MFKLKKDKKNGLVNAPDDKLFWTCDGKCLRNVHDLLTAFKEMNDTSFKHHVNKQKNDFANWTKEVLGDRRLARELRRSRTLSTSIKKVTARIKELEK